MHHCQNPESGEGGGNGRVGQGGFVHVRYDGGSIVQMKTNKITFPVEGLCSSCRGFRRPR